MSISADDCFVILEIDSKIICIVGSQLQPKDHCSDGPEPRRDWPWRQRSIRRNTRAEQA